MTREKVVETVGMIRLGMHGLESKADRTHDGVHVGSGVRREKKEQKPLGFWPEQLGGWRCHLLRWGRVRKEQEKNRWEIKSPALALFSLSLY